MTWTRHHAESERLAAEAELAARAGDLDGARLLYQQAAEAEILALDSLEFRKARTLGVTVVSAVALWFKAQQYPKAQRLAHHWLSTDQIPTFAAEQLQILLQSTWSEQVRITSGVRFSKGEVIVAVRGGEVVTGGAPLDLVLSKVGSIESLFYRTAEFLKRLPHRRRGPASIEIQQNYRPWLFQAAPGSYQFAIAIEEPAQGYLFAPPTPTAQLLAKTFLRILRASAEDPDTALVSIVDDPEYRNTFLKLTRNLAPSGSAFSELEVNSSDELRPIVLLQSSRQAISEAIKRQFPKPLPQGETEESLHGVLRALHLDQDWLELAMEAGHTKIYGVGETVDDLVGPLVNKQVVVEVTRQPSGRLSFRDIQPAG